MGDPTVTEIDPRETFIAVIRDYLSAPSWAFGSYARTVAEQLLDKLTEAGVTVIATGDHPDAPAIIITRAQLASMTGLTLTPAFVERMDEVWPNSSIPEALDTIGESIAEETGAYPAWSDDETADHLLGSGAMTYPWWKDLVRRSDGTYLASIEHPDYPDGVPTSKAFTGGDARRVRDEILAGQHGVNERIVRDLRVDPDADAVDCLLQVLVLGEVVYG